MIWRFVCMAGCAGVPNTIEPGGKSSETPLCAATTELAPIFRWSAMPAWPASVTLSPISTLPAIPACEITMQFLPTLTLRAIDPHVRANLDVVLDDHIADLRNLQPLRAVLHITEAVAANHRAGVNADAVADADVVVDGDVRVEQAIVAKAAAFADDAMRFDDRAVADRDAIAQHHVLADKHALTKAHVAAELRGGMDLRGIETRRTKNRQGPRKRGARVFYPDQRLPRGGGAPRDDDDGGGAPFRGGAVFGIFRKRDLRDLRLRDRRDAGKRDVRVAFHLATDPRREILNGDGHCAQRNRSPEIGRAHV